MLVLPKQVRINPGSIGLFFYTPYETSIYEKAAEEFLRLKSAQLPYSTKARVRKRVELNGKSKVFSGTVIKINPLSAFMTVPEYGDQIYLRIPSDQISSVSLGATVQVNLNYNCFGLVAQLIKVK